MFLTLTSLLVFSAYADTENKLVILYTGDTIGHVEPCG